MKNNYHQILKNYSGNKLDVKYSPVFYNLLEYLEKLNKKLIWIPYELGENYNEFYYKQPVPQVYILDVKKEWDMFHIQYDYDDPPEIEQYVWGKLNLKSYFKEIQLHKQLVRGVVTYSEFLLTKA